MKKLDKAADHRSRQAQPAASKTGPRQPAPHDPKSDPGKSDAAKRIQEAEDNSDEVKPRAHEDAVTAQREPVAAPRSQDADPNANKGVTVTTEGGTPVAHPGSTLR